MDENNVIFEECLSKLIEVATNNKNVIEYDEIPKYMRGF